VIKRRKNLGSDEKEFLYACCTDGQVDLMDFESSVRCMLTSICIGKVGDRGREERILVGIPAL
jgi:hypothetical protein